MTDGNKSTEFLSLTADIVSSHVSNNSVAVSDLPGLISNVYAALSGLGTTAAPEEKTQEPTVSIRSSVKAGYIVCLEDGKKLKMLKRHLMTRYGLTPDAYRAKWKLPADYPMVAPSYAERRRSLALHIGLGRKATGAPVVAAPPPKKARASRKASAPADE